MSLSPQHIRWSGWLLFAGALLTILVTVFSSLVPVLPLMATAIIDLLGGLLVAVGFPATYLKQRNEIGPLGMIGFFLLWLASLATTIVLSIAEIIIVVTNIKAQAIPPAFITILNLTGLFVLIGALLYGAQTIRVRIFPPISGWLLIAAVIINTIQLFIGGLISALLYIVWALLLQISFARFGYSLARWPDDGEMEEAIVEEATMSDMTQ